MDYDPFILLNGWIQSNLLTSCFFDKLSSFFMKERNLSSSLLVGWSNEWIDWMDAESNTPRTHI